MLNCDLLVMDGFVMMETLVLLRYKGAPVSGNHGGYVRVLSQPAWKEVSDRICQHGYLLRRTVPSYHIKDPNQALS